MIYNAGTISFNGNTVTGAGTNFTAPSSQIRIGQTLLVASNPVQLVQITAINSATSLTVAPAASPAVSGQKYGIFITDSLSVDGLAQSISQLINEYDENIGAWETFATTTANQNVTVTINGQSAIIPAMGKLLQKGSNGALTVKEGGTGATDAAGARTNLGLVDSSGAVPISLGGTGKKTPADARTALGVPAGVDSQVCTAWVLFNGLTGGVRSAFNVSSITKNGTGDYTINFSSSMNTNLYCCNIGVMAPRQDAATRTGVLYASGDAGSTGLSTESCRILVGNTVTTGLVDQSVISAVFFGGK